MRTRSLLAPVAMTAALLALTSQAHAQLATYNNEAQFVAAVGSIPFESFENLAPRVRDSTPINVADFTVTPTPGLLGVQDGPNSPETGFGAFAIDGTHYLFVYQPNLPAGTLRFDLKQATTAFGFFVTDLGEIDGSLTLSTDTGETLVPQTIAQFPPINGGGVKLFFGFTQATPFTQVFLTSTGIDDSYGLDKVYIRSVPEASVWVSALVGGVPLALLLRRRRK